MGTGTQAGGWEATLKAEGTMLQVFIMGQKGRHNQERSSHMYFSFGTHTMAKKAGMVGGCMVRCMG